MQALAAALRDAGIPCLHIVVPPRGAVLGAAPEALPLEQQAAGLPLLAQDWVPLRQAFARQAQPMALWRQDGRRLTVEGTLTLLRLLLAVLRLRFPEHEAALVRAMALADRAEPGALPRREIGEESGLSFLGVPVRETEPALPDDLFTDLPPPQPLGPEVEGVEAWRSPAAPLPWRLVLLATPGLAGSAGPAALGWWLRRLCAECVISEALDSAPPAAVVEAAPTLVVTLVAG
jgi:hypothetical protein